MSLRSIFPSVSVEERPRLMFAVGAFACVASAGVVARTAGGALFLSAYPASALAPMYVASAAILMTVAFGVGWAVSRMTLSRLLPGAALGLVAVTLLLRVLLATGWQFPVAAVYLFSDLVSKVPSLLFWSAAASMFDPRQAKRLYVIVGAGGTAACVAAGALIGPFTKALGTPNLLLVLAALLAGFGLVARNWMLAFDAPQAAAGRNARPTGDVRYYGELLALPQLRHIATIAVISAFTLLLTDFLFKSSASAHYSGAGLAGFFGIFYSATSLTALFVQLFLVHAVLRRGGVFAALATLPVSLAIASLGAALTGGFGWAIAAKFVDPVFDFTLTAAATQLLYLGVRKQSRSQARAFVEGFARPCAVALGGLFLVTAAATIAPRTVAAIVFVLTLAWLFAARNGYRSYVAGLVESIGVRRFDPLEDATAFGDRVVETHLREALRSATDDEVLYLLGILPHVGGVDWRPEFRELLQRDSPEIRVAALDYLRERGDAEDLPFVCEALDAEAPAVRTAAIRGLAKLATGDAAMEISRFLEDRDPHVRAAAVAELMNVGDLDALLAACLTLKAMLHDPDHATRAAAAQALSRVTYAGLGRVLNQLLADPDPAVRRAALAAGSERPDPHLVPSIIRLLGDPELGAAAADALASYGANVLPHLASFPDQAHGHHVEPLLLVPSVLARTRDAAAVPLLVAALDAPDLRMRKRVVSALCDLSAALPPAQRPSSAARAAVVRELTASLERGALLASVREVPSAKLLAHVLDEERQAMIENAFTLLGSLHPKVNMSSMLWVLRSGTAEKRAEALEVLDNVLDAQLRGAVVSVFEPAAGSAAAAPDVDRLLGGRNSQWVVASAAYTKGRGGASTSLDTLRELLGSDSPYVREAALDALSRLAPAEEVRIAADFVSDDPHASVRRLASRLLGEVRP